MKKRVFLFVIVLFFGCQKLKDADFGRELEVIKNQRSLMSKFKYACLEISVSTSELPLSTNLKEVDRVLRSYGYIFL